MGIPPLPSYERIDYRVRLNKGAERKMLVELFRRLSYFQPVKDYRYIGMGATTFTDFNLFHRELGISDMISLEEQGDQPARFEFNKPFDCIQIMFGNANSTLPQLDWDKQVIVWLDYDKTLTESKIIDVALLASRLKSGSILIITVNATGYKSPRGKNPEERPDISTINRVLRKAFEKQSKLRLPPSVQGKDLQGIGMAITCRTLVEEAIGVALRDRNGGYGSESPDEMRYRPLLNLVYKDGAQMLTIGGILYKASDQETLEKCRFEDLEFTRQGNSEPFEINLPILTPRERRYLDQNLPVGNAISMSDIGLTQEQIDNYARLYRYCPFYAEVELT